MNEILDPAFPVKINRSVYTGMTRRDYFAAKAMQGLLAHPNLTVGAHFGDIAQKCYCIADFMLAESDKVKS